MTAILTWLAKVLLPILLEWIGGKASKGLKDYIEKQEEKETQEKLNERQREKLAKAKTDKERIDAALDLLNNNK